jgi:DNA modification methylase
MNQLILGDNLEVLKSLPDASVDLVYIDPPFFSNRNYSVIWGDKGEIRSFEDCWQGGVDTYINWMYKRVEQIHRILKPTGIMYLHCDYHANAELKVYVMNKIFGMNNLGKKNW